MSIVLAALFKLSIAIIGFMVMRFGLMWFDKAKFGQPFMERVNAWDNHSQALYFGLRIVAAALAIGLPLS